MAKTPKTPQPDPAKEVDPAELPPTDPAMTEPGVYSGDPDAALEGIEIEEPDGQANASDTAGPGEEGPALNVPVTADGLITPEAFADLLAKAIKMAGHLTALKTLLASPDAPEYPPAAAAIYDTLRDIPALHFMLRPGGKWVQRAAAFAAFIVPVAMGCAAEIKARSAAAQPGQPSPADTAKNGDGRGDAYEFAAKA